jgi:hypothetical protein
MLLLSFVLVRRREILPRLDGPEPLVWRVSALHLCGEFQLSTCVASFSSPLAGEPWKLAIQTPPQRL